jgi:tetratricopeptide (TPR) repeat protein
MTGKGQTRNEITGGIFFSAVIQGRDITVQLPPQVTPALSGLPAPDPAFRGRETILQTLLDMLAPRLAVAGLPIGAAAPAVLVTAVGGLAGVGKTELAVQAAHIALDRGWFPGGVLFADLFGYDPARSLGPGQALEGFLRALGIPGEHIPPEVQDRARLYASVLAAYACEGRPILVVADNASAHEQAEPLLPADGRCAAIVTSRDTLAMLKGRLLDLDVLSPDASAVMLGEALRMARPGDTRVTGFPDEAAAIARLCGGLPLALRIIAALLAEDSARPLAAMAADLRDEHTRLDEMSYGDIAVRAAFDLSCQRLDPRRAQLFRLLPASPGPYISTQAAAALTAQEQAATRRGLEALARAHLIERGSGYGRWQMHYLVRLYAQQLSDANAEADGREQALDRLLGYFLDTADAADDHLRALAGMARPAEFAGRDEALAWLDAERPGLLAAVSVAAGTGRDQIAIRLPLVLARYLNWRRRFDDTVTVTTIGLATARRLGDRPREGAALNSLGSALQGVRRFDEAITACQDAAVIYRETGDRHGEGAALTSLGLALQEARRFDEAITACQDAAVSYRETGDRHGEGMALGNLGLALREARRFDEAITACQDAAVIFRETGDRRREGSALGDLESTRRPGSRLRRHSRRRMDGD